MKKLIILLLLPITSFAGFSKPQLIARLSDSGAWNAPTNMWCFSSEPGILKNKIHLGCFDEEGVLMAQWSENEFKVIARAQEANFFSHPVNSFNKISWTEYNEWSVLRSYESTERVKVTEVRNLGPMGSGNDSFLPYTPDSWIYRLKGDDPQLWIWKENKPTVFFNPGAAFIFTPYVGPAGEIVFKSREINYNESSPDRLWLYHNGEWRVVLEDQDANPNSKWTSIRAHATVEGDKVLAIASEGKNESLILINGKNISVLAQTGKDLAKFDFFSPKMRAGIVVVRGEDFEGRKVTYIHDEKGFRRLLSQGDIVQTDIGVGRVHYENRDAIFYGAPGLDEMGNVVLQATLTDADHPSTLLGIGLIKFNRE